MGPPATSVPTPLRLPPPLRGWEYRTTAGHICRRMCRDELLMSQALVSLYTWDLAPEEALALLDCHGRRHLEPRGAG